MNICLRTILWLALATLAPGGPWPATAQTYDMDCKVILCLAGGFPSGCSDARSYMLNRLRKLPPKPPFGFCAMGDAAGARVEQGRDPYLPCNAGFALVQPSCDHGENCRPVCTAQRDDHTAARTLGTRTELPGCGTETRGTPADPRDSCVSVDVPDREDGNRSFVIRYDAKLRPKPNWIQLHLGDSGATSFSSERFWWSR